MANLPHFRLSTTSSGTVSAQTIQVQPLSAPSGILVYTDVTYKPMKGKRGRKSSMRRFKIKYTNTKGVVKTRNIKATSEEKAMSEIKDMSQHHYTIVESLDESSDDEGDRKILLGHKPEDPSSAFGKWQPIVTAMQGKSNFSQEKINWLSKYAATHAAWEMSSYNEPEQQIYKDPNESWNYSPYLPLAIKVAAQTMSLDLKPQPDADVSPSSEEKKN